MACKIPNIICNTFYALYIIYILNPVMHILNRKMLRKRSITEFTLKMLIASIILYIHTVYDLLICPRNMQI